MKNKAMYYLNKITIKKILSKVGIQVVKAPHKGIELGIDLQFFLPDLNIRTIFDVGANEGQSIAAYRVWFPSAKIHSFEPVASTFSVLLANVNDPKVFCHNLALGSEQGSAPIKIDKNLSGMNSMLGASQETGQLTETIKVDTLDAFCEAKKIDHIDFLKIDTEGFDLEVLRGASGMLARGQISLIEIEAGMNPFNTHHTGLEIMKAFLEELGYLLFGIYEQVYEWPTKQPQLRRSNCVFISNQLQKGSLTS